MTVLRWGSATDVGMVRDINQDAFVAEEGLFAVADGMGGHLGGEVASATALEVLQQTFSTDRGLVDLVEAVRRANAKVWDKAQLDEKLHGMGTTLTAMAEVSDDTGQRLAVVHVGDSRSYLFRSDEIKQLTDDHSFVGEMVRAGEISPEEAETHPKRNIVTRALGVEPTVEADVIEIDVKDGDRFLLCSDGLTREVTDDQIAATLRRLKSPEEAAKDLVAQAKAHGGHDNITVVVVDVELEGDKPVTISVPDKTARREHTPHRAPRRRGGRVTFRTVLFLCTAVALIGVGVGSVVWYARSSYYVGLEGEQLVIYRGRPDPVLWFHATVSERTDVSTADVLPRAIPLLQAGATQSSVADARSYVRNLTSEAAAAHQAAQSPVTPPDATTTSTSLPAR